jgi:hypothetical protein
VSNRGRLTAASIIIGVQAALGVVAAVALMASGRRMEHWALFERAGHHRVGLGLLVLLIALAGVSIAAAVASRWTWARTAAYVYEAIVVLGALIRIGFHPLLSLISLAAAIPVVVLIAGYRSGTPVPPTPPPSGEPGAPASAT